MAINVSRDPDFIYTFLRRWDVNGHEVALMTLSRADGTSNANNIERFLLCECDFPEDKKKPIVLGQAGDPHSCPAKKQVRESVKQEFRKKYVHLWLKMTAEEIVFDIWKRVSNGEYLGESMVGFVYVQEVAELAFMTQGQVRSLCNQLYAEEKLELNGAILSEFTPGFRFPLEMEGLIAYVVEEPLGWPNGDAGMFALAEISNEIAKRTGVKSGKEAFGQHFPHIDRKMLVPALEWLASSLKAATKNKKIRNRLCALSTDEITKDFKWLPQKHPEIQVQFYAEFIKAILGVIFNYIQFEKSAKKKAKELSHWADFFARMAKSFQNPNSAL